MGGIRKICPLCCGSKFIEPQDVVVDETKKEVKTDEICHKARNRTNQDKDKKAEAKRSAK